MCELKRIISSAVLGLGGGEAEKIAASIRRRWSWQVNQQYQKAGGLVLTPEQWYEDWMDVLGSASSEERRSEGTLVRSRISALLFWPGHGLF